MLALLILTATPDVKPAVDAAQAALTKAGYTVTQDDGDTAGLGWTPRTAGRRLIVTDTSRTTTAVPYAELRKEPAKPANPRLTLWFIPRVRLHASANLVLRQQPAEVAGEFKGAVVFVQQPPQGGDVDDGKLYEAIRASLLKPIDVKRTQSGANVELEIAP